VSSTPPSNGNNNGGTPRYGGGKPGPSIVPPPPGDRPTLPPRSPRVALEPERVPLPKRRSTRARHPLVIVGNAIFMVLVLVAVTVGAALYVGKQRFDAPGPLSQEKVVNIPRGLGIRDIAMLLQREGVIDQPYVFIGGVMVMKARGGLKHGEYKFTKHASLADVVDIISEGKVVRHALTLPEGLTSEQIVARLLRDKTLSGQIKEIPPEGSLLPETYQFSRGETRAQMIKRMQNAQQRLLKDIWTHREPGLPLTSPQELVTLASIVEKETGKADERSRVAAVFVNRLRKNMRLQSDPTIIYGLTGGKGSLGRPIKKSEIEQPTPFNTYVIKGLPPGPIANPGKASLEAVAHPARTKDLYFVADGTGGHVFSETYEQHQKNVAHLREIEHAKAQAPEAKPAAPADKTDAKKDAAKP
jgi:peptidoglycan lytic transglycosylase G